MNKRKSARSKKYIASYPMCMKLYMLVTWQMSEVVWQSHVTFRAKGMGMGTTHPRAPLQGSTLKSQSMFLAEAIFRSALTVQKKEVAMIRLLYRHKPTVNVSQPFNFQIPRCNSKL